MKKIYRKLLLIHVAVFFILLITWICGEEIKTEAGSPFSALYYVLHIFLGSIIFILTLVEWITRNQTKLVHTPAMPQHLWINQILHRGYYLILMALPLTGIIVFFDFMESRPFYLLHGSLFNLLLILIMVNLASMMIEKLKVKPL
ncbi:hypothetical protein GALL_20360 [mine drainage metagenome]|uniref:Cytochrome b561 bacterial/Ni-hydrogenase domain-containing protein n=1 Tax=mine drainage metagenome TaxID=410659 RepID=A0A1J5U0J3_9ZZZZ